LVLGRRSLEDRHVQERPYHYVLQFQVSVDRTDANLGHLSILNLDQAEPVAYFLAATSVTAAHSNRTNVPSCLISMRSSLP
jgi:hypothetical protein